MMFADKDLRTVILEQKGLPFSDQYLVIYMSENAMTFWLAARVWTDSRRAEVSDRFRRQRHLSPCVQQSILDGDTPLAIR